MKLTQQQQAALAVKLGYTQYANAAAHEDGITRVRMDLAEYVLTQDPFIFIGPFIIVKEMILDDNGKARIIGNRFAIKRTIRLRP
jgi:hypothetical protein